MHLQNLAEKSIITRLVRFANQTMETVLIAMGFAHGSHTGHGAGEAVQALTLQAFGLQARRNAVTDKNKQLYRFAV